MVKRLEIQSVEIIDPMEGDADGFKRRYAEVRFRYEGEDGRSFITGKVVVETPQDFTMGELRELCVEEIRRVLK